MWVGRYLAIRVVELARVTRATAILAVAMVVTDRIVNLRMTAHELAALASLTWLALVAWRSAIRLWLVAQRRHGRFMRRTIVVGGGERTAELIEALVQDPAHSTAVIGVIGPPPAGRTRPHRRCRGWVVTGTPRS